MMESIETDRMTEAGWKEKGQWYKEKMTRQVAIEVWLREDLVQVTSENQSTSVSHNIRASWQDGLYF